MSGFRTNIRLLSLGFTIPSNLQVSLKGIYVDPRFYLCDFGRKWHVKASVSCLTSWVQNTSNLACADSNATPPSKQLKSDFGSVPRQVQGVGSRVESFGFRAGLEGFPWCLASGDSRGLQADTSWA